MSDCWVANLSDGSTRVEEWLPGHLSPWQRLMEYCKTNNAYVTALRLTIGTETMSVDSNARGYWQSHGMPTIQGVPCDEELHKWRGIGWVGINSIVNIIWGARDPVSKKVIWWQEQRSALDQAQVVWSKKPIEKDLLVLDGGVKNVRKYSERLTVDA